MAFRHGSKAQITINAVDLSAYSDTLELSVSPEVAEVTAFGATWRSNIAGLLGATLSVSGSYDPTLTVGPAFVLFACMTGQAAVPVIDKPGGTLTGQRTNTFNAFVTGYTESSSIDDKIAWSAELTVDGAIVPTTQ